MEEIKEKLKEINILIKEEKERTFLIFVDGKHIEISKFFVKMKGVNYLNFFSAKNFADLIIDTGLKKDKITIRMSKKHVGIATYDFKIGRPSFEFKSDELKDAYYPDYIVGLLIEFIMLKINDFNQNNCEVDFK